ncbi:hypothetical protein [Paenibacillus polymyxa]|uniref:hypothetical protein n=1 Tax=Paenibacillus polymyxa TaxID=1406 RepID=UPI00068E3DF6|nr:hypothetical protein [Paenibacillus polymyxa]
MDHSTLFIKKQICLTIRMNKQLKEAIEKAGISDRIIWYPRGGLGMTTDIEIISQLESHRLWIETIGEQGEKLGIDEIDLRNVDLSQYSLDQAYITACWHKLKSQRYPFIFIHQLLYLQI